MNDLIRTWFVLAFVCLSFVSVTHTTHAATLFFSPASGSYVVGKTFTVNVMVASTDQAANAYSGTISYPTDKLEMTTIGKGGSIVSLWVKEPSFTAGRATFEGITLNPGYKGGVGKLVSLTFRAKAVGTATIRFSVGSVLANDGAGTSILKGMGSAIFTIVKPTEQPPEAVGVPATPQISSISHPDSTQWYALSKAAFGWALPAGVDGVSILVDQVPTTDPGTVAAVTISSYIYESTQDGVWYFHLRVHNKGGWSGISTFKFQIDTKKPDSFTITEVVSDAPNLTTKAFSFNAVDSGSGIDHYEVRIDDGAAENWVDDGTHIYHASSLSAGEHRLYARAVDKAGNFIEASAKFTVVGLAPPLITEYPASPRAGDELVVKGITLPNSRVTIWIQKGEDSPYSRQIISDLRGKFAFVAEDRLEQSRYQIWAIVSDAFGNVSQPSEKIALLVKAPPFDVWGWTVRFAQTNRCAIINSLLLLILLILLWKYLLLKRKHRTKEADTQDALRKAFSLLRDDIEYQVKTLEKAKTERALTSEEDRILEKLKQDLETAEKA